MKFFFCIMATEHERFICATRLLDAPRYFLNLALCFCTYCLGSTLTRSSQKLHTAVVGSGVHAVPPSVLNFSVCAISPFVLHAC